MFNIHESLFFREAYFYFLHFESLQVLENVELNLIHDLNPSCMHCRVFLICFPCFIEQAAYPPNHYVKSVPQKNMHIFTCCQVLYFYVIKTITSANNSAVSLSRGTDGNHVTSILHCHWLMSWWRTTDYTD